MLSAQHLSSAKSKSFAGRSAYGKKDSMAKKDPAAVRLGRRGGKAYAENHSKEEREQQARKAATARWDKKKKNSGTPP
jgi:hypothetical protein